MISEATIDQACLYVLGMLPKDAADSFATDLTNDPELTDFVAALHNATLALAAGVPRQELPADHKRKLLAALSEQAKRSLPAAQNIKPGPWKSVIPWGAAAAFAVLGLWQGKTAQDAAGLAQTRGDQLATLEAQYTQAQQSLTQTSSELEQSRTDLQTQRTLAQTLQTQIATSDAERQALAARLSAAEARDLLAQAKVAVLSSLIKNNPKALAVSLWDQTKQNGVLIVENLPKLAPGKDYQLWVLDPAIAAPVSAGVFKVDADGKVRLQFKPTQAVPSPGKFAVTIEKEGGVPSPTLDQMVVLGGF